ncbi:MAG TPA: Imm40 family immunity protein [Ktedonobacteraceae bacterium]|nr:Imm40 family immunity protein [Ktedonobacteraceae bacterium]
MPMHPEYRNRFPDTFPQALIDSALSLEKWKLTESIWKYEDIKKVINFLVDARYLITGGDVYLEEAGQFFQMPDNWYLKDSDPRPLYKRTELERKYLLEASREQSLAYVENYWRRNGDHYYYAIVFSEVNPDPGK